MLFTLGACSNDQVYHGYAFKDLQDLPSKIKTLKKDQAKQDDIIALLGSPTFQEISSKKKDFFYLEEIFQQKPVLGKKLQKINLLRLSFGEEGKLEKTAWLEIEGPYSFNPSKSNLTSRYDLQFFEQIQKNFSK
jgi:outer membrane protein assembly factor BamE (lipoprotein component of BamABCDE complex)